MQRTKCERLSKNWFHNDQIGTAYQTICLYFTVLAFLIILIKALRTYEHSGRCHSQGQTPLPWADGSRAAGTLLRSVALPWGRPGIWVAYSSECWSTAGSHRDTCRKNASFQSRKIRPPNSSSDTCTPENRFHA